MKAREIGVSQTIAGQGLWKAKYHPERRVVYISRNGQEAKELIQYCKILGSEDPDLGVLSGTQNVNVPSFHMKNCAPAFDASGKRHVGRIIAEAASPSAGRGGGKLHIYLDEYAHGNFKFWGRQIWQSVLPSITLGGYITVVSTPQGKANMFYRLYHEALAGLNNMKVLKLPWDLCPVYNPKGYMIEDPDLRKKYGEQSDWFRETRPGLSDQEWGEEYDCDFTSSAGLVFPEFDPLLSVGDHPYNPEWPVFFCQDFGFQNPAVTLAVQVSPSEDFFVVEELYRVKHSTGNLIKGSWRDLFTKYRPWDWLCDPSDPDSINDMQEAGYPATAAPQYEVMHGIKKMRSIIKVPQENRSRLHIDRSCSNLITDLSTWAFKPDKDEPEKDQSDHGPDALRYFFEYYQQRAAVGTHAYTWNSREQGMLN